VRLFDVPYRVMDAVRDGLSHPLHRIADLSCMAGTTEGSRQLRGEKIDLASDGIRALEVGQVQGFVELCSKIYEPVSILPIRTHIEHLPRVGVAA